MDFCLVELVFDHSNYDLNDLSPARIRQLGFYKMHNLCVIFVSYTWPNKLLTSV